MKKFNDFALLGVLCCMLNGCANPTVIEREKAADLHLSCDGLEQEMAECENFRKTAEDEKGATGKNVAAAVFFWPALLATYSNVNDASKAAAERKSHLMKLYAKKQCHTTDKSKEIALKSDEGSQKS